MTGVRRKGWRSAEFRPSQMSSMAVERHLVKEKLIFLKRSSSYMLSTSWTP